MLCCWTFQMQGSVETAITEIEMVHRGEWLVVWE